MTLFRRSIAILVMLSVATIVALGAGFQLNEHGARGMAQGGAFAARAITRDVNSKKAKELSAQGAEVVAGHLGRAVVGRQVSVWVLA